MSSHRTIKKNSNIPNKNNDTNKRGAASGAISTVKESKSIASSSNKEHTQSKTKSIVTVINPQTKTTPHDLRSVEDTYIPSIQSTQLNKQGEIASVSHTDRLLNIMKKNGINCQPAHGHSQLALPVDSSQLELIICIAVANEDGSSKKCQCNKYYPPQFQMLGSSCHFCQHSVRFHRVKPEREEIIFDDTKSESERTEYKHWFDKFIELQRLYCSTDKNLSFDDNLFIKIYDETRQAALSFIQSPNYKYVLIKYVYDCVYDEGESLFRTRYQILSLQTMQPVQTDESLQHSSSSYRDNTQTESGFRTILWDLNQPATLIATEFVSDSSYQTFMKSIVNIECPSIN